MILDVHNPFRLRKAPEASPDVEAPEGLGVTPSTSPRERVGWVDLARGIGIVLVVFGHAWRGIRIAGLPIPDAIFSPVDQYVYSFHMPLFFFLAGLFAERAADKPTSAVLREKLGGLAYPYVLWTLIQGGCNIAALRWTNAKATWPELIDGVTFVRPYAQYWFLHALLIIQLAYLVLNRLGVGRRAILGLAIVVALGWKSAPIGTPLALVAAFREFPFFALGLVLGPALTLRATRPGPGVLAVVGLSAFGLLAVVVALGCWRSPIAAVLGIAGMVAASLLWERVGAPRLVYLLGALSLPIYLIHTIGSAGARIVLVHAFDVRSIPVHVAAGVAAGLALPIAVDRLAKGLGISSLFVLRPAVATRRPRPGS